MAAVTSALLSQTLRSLLDRIDVFLNLHWQFSHLDFCISFSGKHMTPVFHHERNQFPRRWRPEKWTRCFESVFELSATRSQKTIFWHYRDATEISFYYFHDTKLCAKHEKNKCEFHLHGWDHYYKVTEQCLVDWFHREFRGSTWIILRDYCIAKCKMFSAHGKLLKLASDAFLFASW